MAHWTRRELLKAALACVSTSLIVLRTISGERLFAQSCGGGGGGPIYYDYYGCSAQMFAEGVCVPPPPADGCGGWPVLSGCWKGPD